MHARARVLQWSWAGNSTLRQPQKTSHQASPDASRTGARTVKFQTGLSATLVHKNSACTIFQRQMTDRNCTCGHEHRSTLRRLYRRWAGSSPAVTIAWCEPWAYADGEKATHSKAPLLLLKLLWETFTWISKSLAQWLWLRFYQMLRPRFFVVSTAPAPPSSRTSNALLANLAANSFVSAASAKSTMSACRQWRPRIESKLACRRKCPRRPMPRRLQIWPLPPSPDRHPDWIHGVAPTRSEATELLPVQVTNSPKATRKQSRRSARTSQRNAGWTSMCHNQAQRRWQDEFPRRNIRASLSTATKLDAGTPADAGLATPLEAISTEATGSSVRAQAPTSFAIRPRGQACLTSSKRATQHDLLPPEKTWDCGASKSANACNLGVLLGYARLS